jgi:hypothetical protein
MATQYFAWSTGSGLSEFGGSILDHDLEVAVQCRAAL